MLKLARLIRVEPGIIRSQTFPEGKGVETVRSHPRTSRSRQSQTFPEGKGVETPYLLYPKPDNTEVADLPRR